MKQHPVTNSECETCLRKLLKDEGYKLSPKLRNGELGVDIIATNGRTQYHIEVIGYKKAGPARSKDFYEVFFRAISRLNDGAKRLVIALPIQYGIGFRSRVNQYRVGWERIAKIFPDLNIWFIDVDNQAYERYSWEKCLSI